MIAKVFGVSVRTLWNWEHRPEGTRTRPGRPPHSAERREEVTRLVRGELERQGWTAGRQAVAAALGRRVPRRLVSEALAVLKAEHKVAVRRHRLDHRVSLTVLARDAVWAEDSTHLGRLEDWSPVSGEVVRDVAPHRTIGLAAGGPLDAEDVVAILERVREVRGTLPLVWVTDGGGPYVSRRLQRYLERERVVHLRSLPHTPQHNGACERAIGEIKAESGLGRGVILVSLAEAGEALEGARGRLDHARLRPSLDFRTAADVDSTLPRWYPWIDRDAFYEAVKSGVADVEGHKWPSERARRRARREVVLRMLERFGLVRITRGPKARTKTSPPSPNDARTSDDPTTNRTVPEPSGSGSDNS